MGKADAKTKEFWRDNERFADFFNAVIFGGEEVICADDLTELDTDASVVLRKEKIYIHTLSRSRDLVRKYAYGTEFVLLGLENQQKVNYAEPVCVMNYDSAGYWKECLMLAGERRQKEVQKETVLRDEGSGEKEKDKKDWSEVFSLNKGSKIHPIITVILYYGASPWDGPKSLHEMFVPTSEEVLKAVPDYPINLVEIRASDHLVFRNSDVEKVFSAVRKIYRKEIEAPELMSLGRDAAEMVGTVVGSEKIVNMARKKKGGDTMELCEPLKELQEEARKAGRITGRMEGKMEGKILAYYDMQLPIKEIAEKMELSEKEVKRVLREER